MESKYDLETSARTIFRLFFNSNIQVSDKAPDDFDEWGIDLMMSCNGVKKLSLFMEEKTLLSIVKQVTGKNNIQNDKVAYGIMDEVARLIAGKTFGETNKNFTLYNSVKSHGGQCHGSSQAYRSKLGEFAIAIE